jgi:hypothetical protein
MNNIITSVLFFIALSSFGQEAVKGSYQFTASEPKEFSSQKENVEGESIEIIKGSKINVLKYAPDSKLVYFKYWNYQEVSGNGIDTQQESMAAKFNNKTFVLPYDDFVALTQPIYQRYKGAVVGAYTIPFRLRGVGDDFDFESSLSLQSNLVFGFGSRSHAESWLDASFGIGLTGVNLNEKNSDVTEARTASAFTLSTGLLFKPSKLANLGVFFGWDYLGSNDKEVNWKYNKKMWVGLGLNITFNEVKTATPATKSKQ